MKYSSLAISDPKQLVYGVSPRPVQTRYGLSIGGGTLYPELNFTLPNMDIKPATLPEVYRHYRQIAEETLKRAAELEVPGVVLEFETLPLHPQRQPGVHSPAPHAERSLLGGHAGAFREISRGRGRAAEH